MFHVNKIRGANVSELISLHPEHNDNPDSAEWRHTLDVLRRSIAARDPDAPARVSAMIRKIDRERANAAKCIAIMQARVRIGSEDFDVAKEANYRAILETSNNRLSDLRHVMGRIRSAPRDNHDGPTPEMRAKSRVLSDGRLASASDNVVTGLPEPLQATAMDLRCGWMLRSPAGMHVKAAKMSIESRGIGEYGKEAERLERQYVAWLKEMWRQHIHPWAADDTVCVGRTIEESAKLRRSDPAIVVHLVSASLIAYHVLFPPLDKRAETKL